MARRFDATLPIKYVDREGKEQTSWFRCGSAFENDKGNISVVISVLPIGHQGELRIQLMGPRGNGPTGGGVGSEKW